MMKGILFLRFGLCPYVNRTQIFQINSVGTLKKIDEGVPGVKHWKPKEVVLDIEASKENGKFYFSAMKVLTKIRFAHFPVD